MKKPDRKIEVKKSSKRADKTEIARLGTMYTGTWDEELLLVTQIFFAGDPLASVRKTAMYTTGGAY